MQTAEVVVEQLKAVGINATIDAVEWNTWLEDVYTNREYQATISGITCSDLTPGYLLNRFQTDSKKNFVNFKSTEYDELWKATQASAVIIRTKAVSVIQDIITMAERANTVFLVMLIQIMI